MTRNDGLNNPLSINSGIGATWERVWARCNESEAVKQYDSDEQSILFEGGEWVDFIDPQAALVAINDAENA